MTDIASLGYEVDSTQLERGTRALDANAKAAERTAAAAAKVGTSYQAVARASAPVDALANAHIRLKDAYDRENGVRTRLAAYMSSERGMRLAQVQALNSQAKAMDATAISAGQLSNALRGVPAQFTDIVTALQGGQSPMQVLFQQGGQLKDQFGGIGAAARGLAGYIAGLVNPLSITAAAVASYAYALQSAQKDTSALVNALSATGNYVGVTAGQVDMLVESMAELEGVTHGGARAALLAVAESGRIAGDQFAMVAEIAARMEAATGQSIDTTIQKFEEIAKDPVEALLRLNETEHFLTAAHLSRIDALIAEGREQDAAAYGASVYRDRLDDVARAAENARPHLSQMLTEVNKLASAALEGAKNFAEFLAATAQVTRQRPSWQQYGLAGGFNYLRDMYNAKPADPVEIPRVPNTVNSTRERERKREAEAAEQYINRETEAMYGLDTAVNRLEKSVGALSEARQKEMRASGQYQSLLKRAMEEDAKKEEARRKAEERKARKPRPAADPTEGIVDRLRKQIGVNEELAKSEDGLTQTEQMLLGIRVELDRLASQGHAKNRKLIETLIEQAKATDAVAQAELRRRKEAEALAQLKERTGPAELNQQRANEVALMGIGRGGDASELLQRQLDIHRWYEDAVKDLRRQASREKRAVTAAEEQELQASLERQLDAERRYQAARQEMQGDWRNGARKAWEDYVTYGRNTADQFDRMFANTFGGMEEAIVRASQTGKLSFRDLANSIMADLARIAARQAVMGIVGSVIGNLFNPGPNVEAASGGGYTGPAGSWATGGYTGPGGVYEPAGIVHRGEVVWSQADIARAGGVGAVEALRRGVGPAPVARGAMVTPQININLQGAPEGTTASARTNSTGGFDLDMVVGQIEGRMAGNYAQGTGPLYSAVKGRHGLRDQV